MAVKRAWLHRWRRFRQACRATPPLRTWLVLAAGSFSVGAVLILATALQAERHRTALLAAATSERLERRASLLRTLSTDWAQWDETRDYASGRNPQFIARHVSPLTLAPWLAMVVLNQNGELISGVTASADGTRVVPLPQAQLTALLAAIEPMANPSAEGTLQLVQLPQEPALVSLQAIRGTAGKGPVVGQLIVAESLQSFVEPGSPLNQAMGISQLDFRPTPVAPANPLRPELDLPVPLSVQQGRRGLQLVATTRALERSTAGVALAILAAAELVAVGSATLLRYRQQRQGRLRELQQRRLERRQLSGTPLPASQDPLTGLLSSAGLAAAIPAQLKLYPDFVHGLMHVDIDRFSQVNNGLGRERGDRVLLALARWLQEHLHASSLVARVGGDKFAFTLVVLRESALHEEVNRLHSALNQLEFSLDETIVNLSVSSGARSLNAAGPTQEADAWRAMEEAALACDVAKLEQRSSCQFFDGSDRSTKSYLNLQARNRDLLGAIRDDQLDLFAQHAWDLQHPDLPARYVELLVRMRDPAGGRWRWGEDMVQAANLGGSMGRLDRHVLRLAVARLGGFLRLPEARFIPPNLVFAVNITPDTLLDEGFSEHLLQLLDDHALPAQRLCLEITEQVALRNPVRAARTMDRLRSLGLTFAMDDFGTGMTSLGYLRDLPLDYVKIDKSFIRRCEQETSSRMVVDFIVQLGRELGFRTVAEGVETPAMLRYVKELGLHLVQGYITTRPIPLSKPSDSWIFATGGAAVLSQAEP